MRGLWKYISPFAPDQSGAAAVLYGLGGIVVICDAGGCAGNICGFDEPRWFTGGKSAVFSAGLRDMDAILGRDDLLVEKLCLAADDIAARFAAIIGTPVPAVIGTDYRGLKRLAEKKVDLPVITVNTTGMTTYDKGISKAYQALIRTFADPEKKAQHGTVGVLGAVPLELSHPDVLKDIKQTLIQEGWQQVLCYDQLDNYIQAGTAEKNYVVSAAALPLAQYLQRHFGTPYELRSFEAGLSAEEKAAVSGKKVLIVHQDVTAHFLARGAKEAGAASVTTASWFTALPAEPDLQHIALREEDDFCQLADNDAFDVILGDVYFQRALPHFKGTYFDRPHFAVSGRY